MSTRWGQQSYDTLDEVIEALDKKGHVGHDMTWVAKNYSIGALLADLKQIRENDIAEQRELLHREAESDGRSARISKS